MDKKSKIFFLAFFLLLVASAGAGYYRFFVVGSYPVEGRAACDPSRESCFISIVCDPDNEECSGDPQQDTAYYKIVRTKATDVIPCHPGAKSCNLQACRPDESDCEEILCDPKNLAEGEVCTDPEIYTNNR